MLDESNILYLTVDTLRRDRLDPDVMPYLYSIANNGITFSEMLSTATATPASFPGLIASRYSSDVEAKGLPPEEYRTIAEVLRNDRTTIGYSTNPYTSAFYNYDRGFDKYTGLDQSLGVQIRRRFGDRIYELLNNLYSNTVLKLFGNTGGDRNHPNWYSEPAKSVNDAVRKQLPDDSPWFAWVHHNDPHFPLEPPEDFLPPTVESRTEAQDLTTSFPQHLPENHENLETYKSLYDAECRYWDKEFERLHKSLPDDTLVVVVGDHGELMGEFGFYGHPPRMWSPVLEVPCVVYHPELSSKSVKTLQTTLDLAPTILELVGESIPSSMRGEPINVVDPNPRNAVCGNTQLDNGYIQTNEWRWTTHEQAVAKFDTQSSELYPLGSPESEVDPLLVREGHPDVADRLQAQYYQSVSAGVRASGEESHGGLEEHLEDLGYL